MNTIISKTVALTAAAALAGFAFVACTTSSDPDITTDGGNAFIAQETGNMGVVLNESYASPKVASAASNDTDTVTKEKIVVLRHYDTASQCFIRSTQFLNKKGFERSRVDSIWLDSSGHYLSVYLPSHANTITFVRHVKRINGYSGNDMDVTFRTTLVKSLTGSAIVYQWTGTISGTLHGTELTSSSFIITRTYTAGEGFGYASGTLNIERGDYEILFMFDSTSKSANCTVSRNGVLVRTTHIDSNDNET